MVIKWTEFAKMNLKDFLNNTIMAHENAINYIKSLMQYTEYLSEQNSLGKLLYVFEEKEIRQLLYKKHRILYYIYQNEIRILAVIHTTQELNSTIKTINKYFNY